MREQVVGAVAAAGANHGTDFVALEHLVQLAQAAVHGSGEVEVLVKDAGLMQWDVAHLLEAADARLQMRGIDVAGGRDDADVIAGPESGRLEEFRHERLISPQRTGRNTEENHIHHKGH